MRKLAVLILMITVAFGVNAQNSKRTSAFNYLRYGKLDKAKEAIDDATAHAKTMNDAKTWFYAGNVYLAIRLSDEEKYKNLDPDALEKAYAAYLKSKELDEKGEFTNDINDRILVCAEQFYNKGVNLYNEQDYANAVGAFGQSAAVNESMGRVDSLATYNAALCAELAQQNEAAKKYYLKLIDVNFKQPGIYSSLAEITKAEGDTAQALAYVKQGREVFPDDFNLIIAETNIYLATGEQDKAMELLELAIEKDNTNPTLYFAVGTNYDQLGNFEEAEKSYKAAIALNPDYFDPNYNLGALYVNKAIEILTEADALPLNEEAKYNELRDRANGILEASVPYLEKADQLQPDDPFTLRTLKDIYTRLGMLEKLKEVNERLGE